MIAVPVRDDQMIDLLKPGVLDRLHDAAGIADAAAGATLPVSISSDSPDGETNSVALPPSTSMT